MKFLVAFVGCLAVVSSTVVHYDQPAVLETGASAQFRSEDNHGNYNFGYNEDHTSGGTFRREVGDAHGNVAGSYGLRDADGRVRIVNYIANDDGFKADIKTNEPGVIPDDPADATINKAGPVVVVATSAEVPVLAAAPAPIPAAPFEPLAVHPAPYVAIPQQEPVVVQSAYTFPAPVTAVKSHAVAVAEPVAIHAPATYAFPAPSYPVAKTHVAVAETAPVTYQFPAPAAIPVAKTHVAVAETAPVTYQFPAPAAIPVAKTHSVEVTQEVVPVVKKSVAVPVAVPEHLPYTFPAPAVFPVGKSATTYAESTHYDFPPAPVIPAVRSSVAVAHPAPIPYAFPAHHAVPVARSSLGYVAPTTKVSYSTEVVNHAPAAYAVKSPSYAYPAPAPIAYGPVASYSNNPYYYGPHSPVVTYGGPVLRFNNIAYPGYPVVKK